MQIDNTKIVMGVIILGLLIGMGVLYTRAETATAREAQAFEMSQHIADVLREDGYSRAYPVCRAIDGGRYDLLKTCLITIKEAQDLGALFDDAGFRDYDPNRNISGYLVVENARGNKVFKSANFSLYFNNELLVTGCATPGEIAPEFTCRFNLWQECEKGDNLEVTYEGERIHLRNC